jgi:cell division protein FtsQ
VARRSAARGGTQWRPVVGRKLQYAGARRRFRWRLPSLSVPLSPLEGRWRLASLIGVGAMVLALGVLWVYSTPLLSIRSVHVEGNATLSPDVIDDVAGLKGESVINPDFDAARERLLALPLVKDVHIERDLPNGAKITIVERTPFAVWQVNGQFLTVDEDGVVLDLPAPAGVPAVTQIDQLQEVPGPGQRVDQGAMSVARALVPTAEQTLGRRVVSLEFSQAVGLTAFLDGNLRVLFGDATGYEFKLAALSGILQQAVADGRMLSMVDLRFGERVAIQ